MQRVCIFVLFAFSLFVDIVSTVTLIEDLPECSIQHGPGQVCKIHVRNLRPTQFSYGPLQVKSQKKLAKSYYDANAWGGYQSMYKVPLIIGQGQFFLADKHHHVAGMVFLKVDSSIKYVMASVMQNREHLDEDYFWKLTVEHEEVWLHDVTGRNDMDPSLLPQHIEDMYPDCFRDLAYQMKFNGGYKAVEVLYQEFYWANYFRVNIPFPKRSGMTPEMEMWCNIRPYDEECNEPGFSVGEWVLSQKIQDRAMFLSRHVNASNLPGFISPLYFN